MGVLADKMKDHVIIQVGVITTDAGMGAVVDYTGSGSTQTPMACLVQYLSGAESLQYKARGIAYDFDVYFDGDPHIISEQTRLVWIDAEGTTQHLRVHSCYPEGTPGSWDYWVAECELITQRGEV